MLSRDILFPTDFSEASRRAGLVARGLALQGGARLHIVYVVPPVTDPADSPDRLRGMAATLGDGLQVQTALLSGRVGREIVHYARDKGIELIVMGTHGRTGVSRALLGSVAEYVVRTAPCLVLTVPTTAGVPVAGPGAVEETGVDLHRCLSCGKASDDLVCEPCRTRIRSEALEHKLADERAGRRGTPA